ncbi:MAG: metal-dependent hydrolase family protein [Bacillota bacterium]
MVKVIRNVTLIDGTDVAPVKGATVVIEDEKITAAGPSGQVKAPTGAGVEAVDGGGLTLLPGLIDAHIHITGTGDPNILKTIRKTVPYVTLESAVNARKTLEAGFTTIRDAGGEWLVDISLRDAIRDGLVPGPRMLVSGMGLSITGGHGDHFFPPEVEFKGRYVVDSPDEARKAAREQLRSGADLIKLMATGGVMSEKDLPTARGMTIAEMEAAIEEAHNAGKKTLAHAQGANGIRNAILAGIDSIEHGFYLTDEIIGLMLERGVFLVPTLVAVHQIIVNGEKAGIPEYGVRKAKEHAEAHRKSFQKALKAGVKIAMGTDAATPFNFHGHNALELQLMVEAGMTPSQALQAATRMGAELLGLSDKVGTVEPGKLADLVLVDGDPLADIKLLQDKERIKLVVKGGQTAVDRRGGKP